MLKNKNLIKRKAYINGKWVGGKKTFPVTNPFDGKLITKVADLGKQEAKKAVEAADKAFASWSSMIATDREKILTRMADLMEENLEDLAALLTLEQGKTIQDSKDEVGAGVAALKWYAQEACRVHGLTYSDPDPTRSVISLRQPIGVVAAVTPWNFPSYIPTKALAAIAAGCTLVLKPAEDTPLSSLALAHLADLAGVPKGVFNVISCKNPKDVGSVLTTHPKVRKISFVGSTEVGKLLMKMASSTVKVVTLELGGNGPFILFDDGNINQAVEGAFGLKFMNGGQCCNGLNRFLIHTSVYDAFVKKCTEKAKKMCCGSGFKADLGPLINGAAIEKVNDLIQDATKKGAKVVLPAKQKGLLCSPIIIKNANRKMRIWKEEIFGPVIAIYRFKTEKEAIEMANDTDYGLAGYFYTENVKRAMRVSKALEAGSIGVNTTNAYTYLTPFGGWKESGIGREPCVGESLNEYLELKSISFGK